MDAIVQFIVHNFFIVIVVIGFVLSLLNKARRGNTRSGPRMPNFGGNPPLPKGPRQLTGQPGHSRPPVTARQDAAWPERRETTAMPTERPAMTAPDRPSMPIERPAMTTPERPPMTSYSSAAQHDAQADVQTSGGWEIGVERTSAAAAPAAVLPGRGRPSAAADSSSRAPFRLADRGELQRAVVLAEVLGPPRSKRPFQRK
ncbi:hypothetical protein [Paenibacillus humicola]|uniref:hypothetical protein n=1 Tax=Paenibacillus humicola TaxID=3110540 RepID=UPI00237B4729|nr:hypothetical protein [Paenibacillus humicola]